MGLALRLMAKKLIPLADAISTVERKHRGTPPWFITFKAEDPEGYAQAEAWIDGFNRGEGKDKFSGIYPFADWLKEKFPAIRVNRAAVAEFIKQRAADAKATR